MGAGGSRQSKSLEKTLSDAIVENDKMRESVRQCAQRLDAFKATSATEVRALTQELDDQKNVMEERKRTIARLNGTIAKRDNSLEQANVALAAETKRLRKCRDEHARLRTRYERVLSRLGPLDFSISNDTRLVPILGRERVDITLEEVDICDPGRAEITFVYENGKENKLLFYGTSGLHVVRSSTSKYFKTSTTVNGIALFAGFEYLNTYYFAHTNKRKNTWVIKVDISKTPLKEVTFAVRRVTRGGLRDVSVQDYYNHKLVGNGGATR